MAGAEPHGRLALRFRGEGHTIVLGHALGLDRSTLDPLVERLAPVAEVVTWEAPGHGDAEPWSEPWTHASLAGALADDLRAASCTPAAVLGVSQGAYVAMHLALDHPDVVTGLVLVSCEAAPVPPEIVPGREAEVAGWMRSGMPHAAAVDRAVRNFGPDWTGNDQWVDRWLATPPSRYAPAYAALFSRPDLRTRLGSLRCPALVVRGEGDRWVDDAGAHELAASIPGATGPITVAGGYHNPQAVAPDALADAVRPFLAEIGAVPG